MTAENHFISFFIGNLFNFPRQFSKKAVANILYHQDQRIRLAGAQTLGNGIGPVVYLFGIIQNLLRQLVANMLLARFPIQNKRNRGRRNIQIGGDCFN